MRTMGRMTHIRIAGSKRISTIFDTARVIINNRPRPFSIMAAAERYYRLSMKASVAALCQSVGWHGINNGTCDILNDIAVKYLLTIGRTTADYTTHGKCKTGGRGQTYLTN